MSHCSACGRTGLTNVSMIAGSHPDSANSKSSRVFKRGARIKVMRVVVSLPASGFTVAVCGAQTNQKSLRKCPNPASIRPRLGHILAQLRELHRTVLPHWPGQPPFGVPPAPGQCLGDCGAGRPGLGLRRGSATTSPGQPGSRHIGRMAGRLSALQLANHASMRTRQLYERRSEDITLDEVEHVLI